MYFKLILSLSFFFFYWSELIKNITVESRQCGLCIFMVNNHVAYIAQIWHWDHNVGYRDIYLTGLTGFRLTNLTCLHLTANACT